MVSSGRYDELWLIVGAMVSCGVLRLVVGAEMSYDELRLVVFLLGVVTCMAGAEYFRMPRYMCF